MSEYDQNSRDRIWYLEGPFYRYVEDVKRLAARHECKIIDSRVTEGRRGAIEGPTVTLKPEYGGPLPASVFSGGFAHIGNVAAAHEVMENSTEQQQAAARPVAVDQLNGPNPAAPLGDSPPPGLPEQRLAEQLRNVEMLNGSDKLPATLEIGSNAPDVQLGTVVAAAHQRSGKDVAEWNKMKPAARDKLLTAEIEIMRNEAAAKLASTFNN